MPQFADPVDSLSDRGVSTGFVRAMQTGLVLGRHGLRTARRRLRGEALSQVGAEELRRAFEELGPTYVKLAQLVASSPGLFPDVLAEEFRSCLDAVRVIPPDVVQKIIFEELGARAEEIFSAFDPQPLAAASIGQVHMATLHDGTKVVVKVQRPAIRHRLEGDLRILRRLAHILEARWERWRMANPVAVVEDFAHNLHDELNFVIGARNMVRFADNLHSSGRHEKVRVPRVWWEWTTPRVLTMELVTGYSLDRLADLSALGVDLPATLKEIVSSCLEAVLVHGFFHGDIHSGNVMVEADGTVVLLDFGIVGSIDDGTRMALRHALPALLVSRDYNAMADMLGQLGSGLDPADREPCAADLQKVLEPQLVKPLGDISYGEVLIELVRVGTRYRAQVPRELVLVAKQFLYIERYAKSMAPGWSVLSDPDVLLMLAG